MASLQSSVTATES